STFGLLGESKSIETVLYALKKIVTVHPEIIYLVIGKTHPEVIKNQGEQYRNKLLDIVKEHGLENNVLFINKYLKLEQLLQYLTLTDIYLFTSKDPNQAVSGTFAYALSCGCAVISTPIPHAIETLKKGNGILLDRFEEPEEFEKAMLYLLKNPEERIMMSKNAYISSHASNWENIGIQYGILFGELTSSSEDLRFVLPPIKLDHIKKLTTYFGILQFSNFSEPNPQSGYTLDDNARALINMVMYYKENQENCILNLASIYLRFIEGIQRKNGWFDNFMNFEQQLTNKNLEVDLEDANGRALWSLGYLIAHKDILPLEMVLKAETCWEKALKRINDYTAPRAIAYAIKGLYHYYTINQNKDIKKQLTRLTNQLLQYFHINSDQDWKWYEDYLTYANNILPEAMLYSFLVTNNKKYKEIAITTFDFLLSHYFMKGQLKVISNRGWFKKENERSFYGEQPIEVVTTIIALDLFYEVTGNIKYKEQLELAFAWFLGNNHLKQLMYNPVNGASYDGLEDYEININQGAESTLCFFKAQMIMQKYAVKTPNITALI
ncbi:MAG: glycosyltransferase, partial [Flavobacteriaceae bacterium]|nr:glycosyltransferase [Flavobacteriaceae bacterium]